MALAAFVRYVLSFEANSMTTSIHSKPAAIGLLALLLFVACDVPVSAQKTKPFVSKTGRFSIVFPSGHGAPKDSRQEMPSEEGVLVATSYMASTKKSVAIVVCIDYPSGSLDDDDPKAIVDSAQAGMFRGMGDVVPSQVTDVAINGYPGRSALFTSTYEGTIIYGRVDSYLVGERLYQLTYASENAADVKAKKAKGFFDSFKLIRQ
jgi:hypothetical protein